MSHLSALPPSEIQTTKSALTNQTPYREDRILAQPQTGAPNIEPNPLLSWFLGRSPASFSLREDERQYAGVPTKLMRATPSPDSRGSSARSTPLPDSACTTTSQPLDETSEAIKSIQAFLRSSVASIPYINEGLVNSFTLTQVRKPWWQRAVLWVQIHVLRQSPGEKTRESSV